MSYLDFPAEQFLQEEELLTIFTTDVTNGLNKDLEERLVEAGLKIDELEDHHNVLLEMLVNRERELRLMSEIFHLYKLKCHEYEKLHLEVVEESSHSQENLKLLKEFSEQLEKKHNSQSEYLNEVETKLHDCQIKLENANLELESLRPYKEKYLNLEREDEHKSFEISRLKQDIGIIQQKLYNTSMELDSLKEHNEILSLEKQTNIQLAQDNDTLASSYTSLQKQFDAAVEEIENLRRQNQNQREFIDRLQNRPEPEDEKEPELPPQKDEENMNAKLDKIKKGHFRRSSDMGGIGKRVLLYEPVEPEEIISTSTSNSNNNHESENNGSNFNKEIAALAFDPYEHYSWTEEKPSPRSRNRNNHKSVDFDNANLTNISPTKELQKKKEEREKARAKDMYEEYYALTYSSVLMNCPYFDEILEFEGKKKSLYEQIKKEGMPYHTVKKTYQISLTSGINGLKDSLISIMSL